MNLVERFFRDLTEDAVRDGSFASVAELVRAIEGFLAKRNLAPSVTSGKPPAATSSSKSTAPAPPPCHGAHPPGHSCQPPNSGASVHKADP
jgi:hypothetical protein